MRNTSTYWNSDNFQKNSYIPRYFSIKIKFKMLYRILKAIPTPNIQHIFPSLIKTQNRIFFKKPIHLKEKNKKENWDYGKDLWGSNESRGILESLRICVSLERVFKNWEAIFHFSDAPFAPLQFRTQSKWYAGSGSGSTQFLVRHWRGW